MPDYRVKRPASADDLISAAIEKITQAYAEALDDGADAAANVLSSMTPGQRLLLAWYFYWDDVTNGGHAQYFANYTGDLWQDALKASETFGAPEHAMLKKAVALFPGGKPATDSEQRQEQLEKVDEKKLNKLDQQFYDAPASDGEVRAYIQSHAEEFFTGGSPAGKKKSKR